MKYWLGRVAFVFGAGSAAMITQKDWTARIVLFLVIVGVLSAWTYWRAASIQERK